MPSSTNKNKRSGQAMLIAVLSLGGAILGATAIAGFLTLYQIRTTTDSQNSAKAIFAADTGTEWALFNYYCTQNGNCNGLVNPGIQDYPTSSFSNGASALVNCYSTYSASGSSTLCSDPTTVAAISTGMSVGSERAFYLDVSDATTTYP
jgi:hypothetical protein